MTPLPDASFGSLPDGRPARLFTLENDRLRVHVTDFGARMVSIEAPDRDGRPAHVLLGLDDAGAYATAGGSFGAVLGRCANRIGGASFTLDGVRHQLVANDRGNTLHGGPGGFGLRPWTVGTAEGGAKPTLSLRLHSPDGDCGFPGALHASATYVLDGDTLSLELQARTDAPTVVNLSAHPYFNLSGTPRTTILDHELTVPASRFLPTDGLQLPTGELRAVDGTPFDFRAPRRLGECLFDPDPQLMPGRGYDSCLVLDPAADGQVRLAARVHHPASGRVLELSTTQPGLQVYSGNSLDGAVVGRGGVTLRQSCGFALEAQAFPDAPNRPEFPSVVLRPGESYRHLIRYRFAIA